MTAPLDLSQFVHDALTGPRQVESVKELTRSIAEASDAERAALFPELVAALEACLRTHCTPRYPDEIRADNRARAVLAKAKSLGGRA